jgi:NhaA family Na+:H+ antiporter
MGAALVGPLRGFLHHEATGGVLLLAATVIALGWANSPLSGSYETVWTTEFSVGTGRVSVTEDLRHWVNDSLMVLFFFVVGLEIKRELVAGELRGLRTALLPVAAALGGVVLPVVIFLSIAGPEGRQGWGIPMATDIAFAVGVLAVLGSRIPAGARLFLLSLAIVDDIIAIVVIAVFYSATLDLAWLAGAAAAVVPILVMRRLGVRAVWPYAAVGVAMWFATQESGVHATIAGVVLAMLTPVGRFRGRDVADQVQRRLHPVTAFVVIPVFALANAGVDLTGGLLGSAAGSRVTWAVALGLLVGKVVGIALATFAVLRTGLGTLPTGMRPSQVWGLAALAGIGFTVSLFIADLAYPSAALINEAKVGIFAGSLASGLAGAALLMLTSRRWPAGAGPGEDRDRLLAGAPDRGGDR